MLGCKKRNPRTTSDTILHVSDKIIQIKEGCDEIEFAQSFMPELQAI